MDSSEAREFRLFKTGKPRPRPFLVAYQVASQPARGRRSLGGWNRHQHNRQLERAIESYGTLPRTVRGVICSRPDGADYRSLRINGVLSGNSRAKQRQPRNLPLEQKLTS
jgi:hypothetical protein